MGGGKGGGWVSAWRASGRRGGVGLWLLGIVLVVGGGRRDREEFSVLGLWCGYSSCMTPGAGGELRRGVVAMCDGRDMLLSTMVCPECWVVCCGRARLLLAF
jgi:hypothetical protein